MAAAGIGEAGMNLIAGAAGLLGHKPGKVPAPNVDLQAAQRAATSGNLQALPDLETLAKQVNSFSIDELMKNLEKMQPGFAKMLSDGSSQIGSFLKGEVPQDVKDQLLRFDAEKAAGGGYSGSPAQSNLSARDLGLTSLDLIQKGLSSAERWMAQTVARTPMFDFTRMFITPAMQIAGQQQNEVWRYNNAIRNATLDAMPSPLEQAEAGALQSFGAMVDKYGSAALGGMGGGAGAAFGGSGGAGMFGGGGGGGGGSSPPAGGAAMGGPYMGYG